VFQTEFEFSLPRGYRDAAGDWHRDGVMRLATAADEILPLKDPRVLAHPAFLVFILFSRVIVKLGTLSVVNPKVIEGLFSADLQYLQDFYNRINSPDGGVKKIVCPHCQQEFELAESPPGGFEATPWTSSAGR
jgi:hypothetical protein